MIESAPKRIAAASFSDSSCMRLWKPDAPMLAFTLVRSPLPMPAGREAGLPDEDDEAARRRARRGGRRRRSGAPLPVADARHDRGRARVAEEALDVAGRVRVLMRGRRWGGSIWDRGRRSC